MISELSVDSKLRVHRFLPQTRVEGPGLRACIWVQGCPIRCAACAVPWTWPEAGGEDISVRDLAARILDGPKIEGVTFVGGEPFGQAKALALLGQLFQEVGLSVVTFTGYELEHLQRTQRLDWQTLLSVTDLLIDGAYRKDLADFSRPWVGSSNQKYHFLTPRYRHLQASLQNIPNRLEIRLDPNGNIFINGMATPDDIKNLFGAVILSLSPMPLRARLRR